VPSPDVAPVFGPRVEEALAQLQHTELFGCTRPEVLRTLVLEKLRELRLQGWFK